MSKRGLTPIRQNASITSGLVSSAESAISGGFRDLVYEIHSFAFQHYAGIRQSTPAGVKMRNLIHILPTAIQNVLLPIPHVFLNPLLAVSSAFFHVSR